MKIRSFGRGLLTAAAAACLLCLPASHTARAKTSEPPAVKPAQPLAAAVAAGNVLISEFRISGPGGPADEFIELYNNTDASITVASSDATAGWSVAKVGVSCAATPVLAGFIPNGTVIPARRHLLLVGADYSLNNYPAGNGVGATGDIQLSDDIEVGRGIGLFSTSSTSGYNLLTRLDAVGLGPNTGGFCDLLREGTPLPEASGTTQYSLVRKMTTATGGLPQDTNNNAADFVLVTTTPGQAVGDNAVRVLGAPGPENSTSPVRRTYMTESLTAPTLGASQSPNRERNFTVQPCAALGSLLFRRRYTNNSGGTVTRMRFRVIDITTINSPPVYNPQAELRVRDSTDETLSVPGRGTVIVQGLTREEPPSQPSPRCGGLNTSMTPGVNLSNPLAPGESVDVLFRLGVEKEGAFRFYLNIEALP